MEFTWQSRLADRFIPAGKFEHSGDKKEEESIDVEGYSSDEAEEPLAKRLRLAVFRPWESSDSAAKKLDKPTTSQIRHLQKTNSEQNAQAYNRLWHQSAQPANFHQHHTPGICSSHYAQVNHSRLAQPPWIPPPPPPAPYNLPLSMMPALHYKFNIHQSMAYLTPPVSPVMQATSTQHLVNPQTTPLASWATPVNALPPLQRRPTSPTAAATQSTAQTLQQSQKKRPRKLCSSQIMSCKDIEYVEELLRLARTKTPQDFEAIFPYQPNKGRKKASRDMTPDERIRRERSNMAGRKCRRKKLLMKLIEQNRNETNSMA